MVEKKKEDEWNGTDRRIEQVDRRVTPDRRDDIRFEPGKEDRRSGVDRRKSRRDIWKQRID